MIYLCGSERFNWTFKCPSL